MTYLDVLGMSVPAHNWVHETYSERIVRWIPFGSGTYQEYALPSIPSVADRGWSVPRTGSSDSGLGRCDTRNDTNCDASCDAATVVQENSESETIF